MTFVFFSHDGETAVSFANREYPIVWDLNSGFKSKEPVETVNWNLTGEALKLSLQNDYSHFSNKGDCIPIVSSAPGPQLFRYYNIVVVICSVNFSIFKLENGV